MIPRDIANVIKVEALNIKFKKICKFDYEIPAMLNSSYEHIAETIEIFLFYLSNRISCPLMNV